MRKEKQKCFRPLSVFFAVLILLCGCSRLEPGLSSMPLCRVVTGIEVRYENGPIRAQRVYTAADKMQQVLNYLRIIDPYGPPEEDPESAGGSSFRIVLTYSDGCEKTYLQKADRYLKAEGEPWKKIDPKRAQELGRILGKMDSDKIE